jgi:protoporphyrinogen IX oxidase
MPESPLMRVGAALAALALVLGGLFVGVSVGAYAWIKALHVVAIIAWMAGLLYLPRLFVYHCAAAAGSETSETFKVMERRLLRAIMTPAMIATWVFGLWLMARGAWHTAGWMHAKFACVIALSGVHGYLSAAVRAFAEDRNTRAARHWRIVNEAPTALMIVIVVLVVVKPF